MKTILFFGFILSSSLFAQELDVRFLETQRPASEPYNIPLSINERGELKLGRGGTSHSLSINATIQSTYRRSTIVYTSPVPTNHFNLYRAHQGLGWLEIKRTQLEYGAGLAGLVKNTLTLGLIPYRGSIQTAIRYKEELDHRLPRFKMPRELDELNLWRIGDAGTFQTYGGIQAYVGFSTGLINVATSSIGIQNQFLVEIKKLSDDIVSLSVTEEHLQRGQLLLGPFFAYGTLADFTGKRFGIEFILNLKDHVHHELFKEALKGNILELQRSLATTEQKLSWKGRDRSFYYGVPMIAGRTRTAGSYVLVEDDFEAELDVRGQENGGFLRRLRNTYQYVYQTDNSVVLIWSSEANKVNRKEFERNFFSKGRSMGVKGFDHSFPRDAFFGSMISQIGLSFSRSEIEYLRREDLSVLRKILKERCQKLNLSCRKEYKLLNVMSGVQEALLLPWQELRVKLGKLMIKEPALVYAIVKKLNLRKEVYFKFLSERYQSLEGSEVIVP